MSPKDQEQPEPPSEQDGASVPVDPADEDVQTSFERMLAVLKKTLAGRDEVVRWVSAWLPLIVALKSLATTATKLAWRARQLVERDRDDGLLDDELLAEVQARLAELVEAFPEASEVFFGVDNVDTVVRETLADEDARAVVARFGRVVEAKMNAIIARLVDWGLEDGAPELSVEKLEGLVSGLERLLQDVLDRWILPRVYGKFDD